MAKAGNGRTPDWRSRMAEGLRAARAARNGGGAGLPRRPMSTGRRVALYLLGAVFFLASLAILDYGPPPLDVRLGTLARTEIRARVDFEYNDPEAYNRLRNDKRYSTSYVYRYDPDWAESLVSDVDRLIDARTRSKTVEAFRKQLVDLNLVADIKKTKVDEIWKALDSITAPGAGLVKTDVRRPILAKAKSLNTLGVLSDEDWRSERRKSARLPDEPGTIERRLKSNLKQPGRKLPMEAFYPEDRVRSEGEVRKELRDFVGSHFDRYGDAFSGLLSRLVLGRVRPSLTLDKELTDASIAAAVAAVKPTPAKRKKDDILVRAGNEIGTREMLILRAENAAWWQRQYEQAPRVHLVRLGGLLLSLLVLTGIALYWIWRTDPESLKRVRQLAGMAVLALAAILVAKAAGQFNWPMQVVPVVFLAMVATLVFPLRTAAALALLASVLVAVALGLEQGLGSAPILAAGALAGALAGSAPRHRLDLLKAALVAGLASAAAAAGWQLLEGGTQPVAVLRGAGWGLGAALAQGLILAGALPVLEAAFGTTTSISLLELCDQNHPLLKALFLNAPGSHQHSMVVGMLSESAAEAIGADPLLARAGSYYHDIGKIARPEYFVENAPPGQNRHDRLGNSMSAMVVISHVRDGAELAREYRLPRTVSDVISQHHGCTLAEFFYRRAVENGENPSESVYRYPGPRPQTREAAIVLLADTVEAASRSLGSPSVARLKSMVHELANKRLLDGQFDESGLTLKELAAVEAAFTRILTSMFHARIAYPEAPEEKRKNGTRKG